MIVRRTDLWKWLGILVFICFTKAFIAYSADYEDSRDDDEQITVTQSGKEDFTYVLSTSLSRLKAPDGYKFDTTTGSGSPGDEAVEYSGSNASFSYMESAANLPTDSFTISMNGKLIPEKPEGTGSAPTWSASGKTKARLRVVENRATYDGSQEITFKAMRGNSPTKCTWVLEPSVPGLSSQSGDTLTLKKYGEEKNWVFPEPKEYTFYAQDDTDQKAYAVIVNQVGKEYDSIDIGPFHLTFDPALKGEYTKEGTWKYTTPSGDLTANISDLYTVPIKTHGVQVSFEIKDEKLYSASVSWSNTNETSQKISIFDATVNKIEGTFAKDKFTGSVAFDIELKEDQEFGEFYKLVWKKGATGAFKYAYSSADAGTWDFTLTGLKANMLLNDKAIAEATVSKIDQDGTCKGVALKLNAKEVGPYTLNGFKLSFNTLNGKFDYNFVEKKFKFISGDGKVTLDAPKGIGGKFSLDMTLKAESMTAAVTGKKIPAFGGNLEGEISVVIEDQFMNLTEISGQKINFSHKEITKKDGTSISGVTFSINDGELQSLEIDSLIIKYKNVFFNLSKTKYSNEVLALTSTCDIGKNIKLAVEGFTITSAGTLSLKSIEANINITPVKVNGSLALEQSGVKGQVQVAIGPSNRFGCGLSIGQQDEYNYGQLILNSTFSKGLALGSTGFFLFSVDGCVAYNHTVQKTSTGKYNLGKPQEGNHEIGLWIGVKDAANFIALEGGSQVSLGNNPAFSIGAAVAIPAGTKNYVKGSATVQYLLDSAKVNGQLSAEVTIPKGSGSIFKVNKSTVDFSIAENQCSLSAQGKGKILSAVELVLKKFEYKYANQTFSGSSAGSASYKFATAYAYPEGFSKATPDKTVAGFGIAWNMDFEAVGSYEVTLTENNFGGDVHINVDTSPWVFASWKITSTTDPVVLLDCQAHIVGRLDITNTDGKAIADGTLIATSGDYAGRIAFTYTL